MPAYNRPFLLLFWVLAATMAATANPAVYVCMPAREAPRIDGKMERLWLAAPWTTAWTPLRADSPEDFPGFRALYDDNALYLFFRATHLPEPARRSPAAKDLLALARLAEEPLDTFRTDPSAPQYLNIYLDPRGTASESYARSEPGHFSLRVPIIIPSKSPLGSGADITPYIIANAGYGSLSVRSRNSWRPDGIEAQLLYTQKGWVMEMAIPFSALREEQGRFAGKVRMGEEKLDVGGSPDPGTIWGLQAMIRYGSGATAAWSVDRESLSLADTPPMRPFGRLLFAFEGQVYHSADANLPKKRGRAFYQMSWAEATSIAANKKIPILVFQAPESVWENRGLIQYANLQGWDELGKRILAVYIPTDDAAASENAPLEWGKAGCVITSWRGKIEWRGNVPPPLPILYDELRKLEVMERTSRP